MRFPYLLPILLVLTACGKGSSENQSSPSTSPAAAPQSEADKRSYSIGYDLGLKIKTSYDSNEMFKALDRKQFVSGFNDALTSAKGKISEEEIRKAMTGVQQEYLKAQTERLQKLEAEGTRFLEETKKQANVKTHSSGLLYEVVREGTGATPKVEDEVLVHYSGLRTNGQEFDSSYSAGKPIKVTIKRMVQAWQIAIPMMKEGGRLKIYVPHTLGYGPRGQANVIRPYEVLIFNIELLKIEKPGAKEVESKEKPN